LLVGVPSVQQPGLLRVDPGNPNDSYLIHKLEGTAAVGGQMPLGGTPLASADIAVVRQWIADGALPPPGTPPVAPIRVSSLSPLPGSTVPMVPMSIMAVFDRELSASTVDLNTFVVERSGGDGTFGDGNEVGVAPVSVTVPLANPMTAVFDMSAAMPVNDTYRVTLLGSGPTTIQDLSGNSLDGEFSGTFPSGDGTAGGDFSATFIVEGIQPTLTSIQDNVFTPICSGCHTGGGGVLPASMDLTSLSLSFMNLVNVPSVQNGALDRVEPGDPDASYLIRKIEGTAATGVRMPPFGNTLDQETIDAIRQWISDGAAM
jgi:mono/diheme cytochrome c family protein